MKKYFLPTSIIFLLSLFTCSILFWLDLHDPYMTYVAYVKREIETSKFWILLTLFSLIPIFPTYFLIYMLFSIRRSSQGK